MTVTPLPSCQHSLDDDDLREGCTRCGLAPLETVSAPLRRLHQTMLGEVAQWCLANGRSLDLDLAAVVIEAIKPRRSHDSDGSTPRLHLTRPAVSSIIYGGVHNLLAVAGVASWLPGQMEQTWNVVNALADLGRLSHDSEPLGILLEPLQCYGGLGADGRPRPEGVDVDFPCQCHIEHDPDLPPGHAWFMLSWDHRVSGRVMPRSHDAPISDYEPLHRFARRYRRTGHFPPVEDFVLRVLVDEDRHRPALWIYDLLPADDEEEDNSRPVAFDKDGNGYAPKPDRRRKLGYRWEAIGDNVVMHRVGFFRFGYDQYRAGKRMEAEEARQGVPRLEPWFVDDDAC